ncbi:hypothetical protein B296_00013939, partial [Ensete ventricosum]
CPRSSSSLSVPPSPSLPLRRWRALPLYGLATGGHCPCGLVVGSRPLWPGRGRALPLRPHRGRAAPCGLAALKGVALQATVPTGDYCPCGPAAAYRPFAGGLGHNRLPILPLIVFAMKMQ